MNPAYIADNAVQRRRLIQLTANLSDADLARPLGDGGSIAALLAHLAFWDSYYLAQMQVWQRTGVQWVASDVDATNQAVDVLSAALPPRAAAELACQAAEAIDREIEGLPAELATALEAAGRVRILRRSMHRQEHLDEIEAALVPSFQVFSALDRL